MLTSENELIRTSTRGTQTPANRLLASDDIPIKRKTNRAVTLSESQIYRPYLNLLNGTSSFADFKSAPGSDTG